MGSTVYEQSKAARIMWIVTRNGVFWCIQNARAAGASHIHELQCVLGRWEVPWWSVWLQRQTAALPLQLGTIMYILCLSLPLSLSSLCFILPYSFVCLQTAQLDVWINAVSKNRPVNILKMLNRWLEADFKWMNSPFFVCKSSALYFRSVFLIFGGSCVRLSISSRRSDTNVKRNYSSAVSQ